MARSEEIVPEGWRLVALRDIANVVYGKAAPKTMGNVPIIGSGGIYGHTDVALVKDPTIVVGRKGTAGSVYLTAGSSYPSDTTFFLRWKASLDSEFVYHAMSLNKLSGEHAKTTLPSLQRGDLESLLLPLPPLPEQRAISAVIRSVQHAKAATEKVIAATRELKRSLMRHLFTYGPVPIDQAEDVLVKETEVGSLPNHWRVTPLEDVAMIERGKFAHRPRNDPAFYGGEIPFIQTGDVTASAGHITAYSQTLNPKGLAVSKVFPRGTIVITIAANIGYTGILEFDSAFPDSLIGITPTGDVDVEYLNYYLSTQQEEMDRKAPRGTQKNINIEYLRPWPVKLPPLEDQRSIARTLVAVDRKISAEKGRQQALEYLFESLLRDLVTGRRQVAESEVAKYG